MPPISGIKFVASDISGLPIKRRQVSQACANCRKRKKRCTHTDDAADRDSSPEPKRHAPNPPSAHAPPHPSSSSSSSIPNSAPHHPPAPVHVHAPAPIHPARTSTPPSARRTGRFVGDLNPEAMFVEAAAATQPPKKYEVGLWLSSGSIRARDEPLPQARPGNMLDRFFLPYVYRECLPCLPPPHHFAALRSLFLRRIHPLFPVIPEPVLFSDAADPDIVVLKQAMAVAAATHPAMAPHLVLENRGPTPLSFHEFTTTLCTAAQAALQSPVITDRFVQIRAYLMLSLYAQPSSIDEMDLPAVLLGMAMHHTHTLGLHVRDDADTEMVQLYCALWALDKLNAAVYGRPSLVQDQDMTVKITDWIPRCPPCFRLLLMIVEWLNQIIELYRPGPSKEASDYERISSIDLPVLEKLILDADALKVQPTLLATIEILYHAVIIVSCRLPRPGGVTTTRSIPPPSANARRSLAAERISSAISRYSITPIIFVPYAISLSLSVEYRKMRHTRLPMFRARSLAAFRYNCALLKQYADRFWNARVLAGLGEKVIKEMDRIAPDGAEIEASLTAAVDREDAVEAQAQAQAQTQAQMQMQSHSSAVSGATQAPPHIVSTLPAAMQGAVALQALAEYTQPAATNGVPALDNAQAHIDLDIWNSIGPDFNLDAVDNALEANLDVALPLRWDWMPDTA
ncbi:hypothetical protein TD95_000730 [Thielaviopsis punctulata]|uniref:Xylanolytic transcriptional activator regulatory domain-containing protein n=1 Tax=Thielaviopsis punctulata TaxID=72032 RepID=A0A0F4ZLX9_9PEZI|nr:hypothetical protein TD95_000730 [Thielaviopsis punctulata]